MSRHGLVGAHVKRPVGAEQHVPGAGELDQVGQHRLVVRQAVEVQPAQQLVGRPRVAGAGPPAGPRARVAAGRAVPAARRRHARAARSGRGAAPGRRPSRAGRRRSSSRPGSRRSSTGNGRPARAGRVLVVVGCTNTTAPVSAAAAQNGANLSVAEIAAGDTGRYLDAAQARQRHQVLKLGHRQRRDPGAARRQARARGRRAARRGLAPGSRSAPGRSAPRGAGSASTGTSRIHGDSSRWLTPAAAACASMTSTSLNSPVIEVSRAALEGHHPLPGLVAQTPAASPRAPRPVSIPAGMT